MSGGFWTCFVTLTVAHATAAGKISITMLCAISGEAPQVPVASRKTGNVFERRLIEAYIQENGRDPVTGDELALEDLVDLKTQRVVKPRPPTFTSIPSLLGAFQNEWDALTLESFQLKQHVSQLRQELSTALYNNDAATRVIARLTKERDEARNALAKLSLSDRAVTGSNGDAMQVDGHSLPAELAEKVDETHTRLAKTRRKRPVPEDWATPADIQTFEAKREATPLIPAGSRCLALDASQSNALLGGSDGKAEVYSISQNDVVQTIESGKATISDGLLLERDGLLTPVLATEAGEVQIFSSGQKATTFTAHAGAISAIAIHPTGDILASVGVDKSFVLYDLTTQKVLSQTHTESALLSCQFHPDGHFLAVGGANGKIKMFETKTGANAAEFDAVSAVQSLSFSENGTWLASVTQNSSSVGIWDLRKAAQIHSLELEGSVSKVCFDYTGQYLATVGPSSATVQHYDKSQKAWSEPLRKGVGATGLQWGLNGQSLVLLTVEGGLSVLE